MRNPGRIDKICDEFNLLWHRVPDWRLTQLMINAFTAYENKTGDVPFYAEDEEFIEFMKKYISEIVEHE